MKLWRLVSGKRNPLHSRIALLVVLSASLLSLSLQILADMPSTGHEAPEEVFGFGDTKYPVIFAGTSLRGSMKIETIEFFKPLFGVERKVVNPTRPRLEEGRFLLFEEEHRIRFDEPGEYYLKINHEHYLKVLVLDPHEPISTGVIRIFDFVVANLLACNGEDQMYYVLGPERYIQRWFHSEQPGLLLCGPTEKLFRMVVYERFRLPNRMVELPGLFRVKGKIITSTHVVPEIYLPDIGKFVMFDLNYAFGTRWLNAIDFAYLIHSVADDSTSYSLTDDQWSALRLDVFQDTPMVFRPVEWDVLKDHGRAVRFSPDLVSSVAASTHWLQLTKRFYGGVMYRGHAYYGTGFLPSDYNFATLHTDRELMKATVSLVKSYEPGKTVSVFPLKDLEQRVASGFNDEIEAQAWRRRVPRSVLEASENTK